MKVEIKTGRAGTFWNCTNTCCSSSSKTHTVHIYICLLEKIDDNYGEGKKLTPCLTM